MLVAYKKNPFYFRSLDLCGAGISHLSSDRPPSFSRQNKSEHSWAADCPYSPAFFRNIDAKRLCDELNNTTGGLDLLLGVTADVAGTDDDGDLGETALSEDLGVAEGQEVDDGGDIGLLAAQVGITLLSGDERPEL